MMRIFPRTRGAASALAASILLAASAAPHAAGVFPDPAVDEPRTAATETAVLAGGCFWGMEGVFERVKGVSQVVSGYAGGEPKTATYEQVGTGTTGHAESVEISYDPRVVTYGQLLKVFFQVAHDPTELDRQGPDAGAQYRSAVFYANDRQKRIAEAYVAQLQATHTFARPIVTQLEPLDGFYPAESYHQGYLDRHPYQPYIVINDLPKIAALKEQLPGLYAAGR